MRNPWIIFVLILIPLLLLTACNVNPFKVPLFPEQDIEGFIDTLVQQVKGEEWDEAHVTYEKLIFGWKTIHRRVFLNAQEGDISDLETALSELRAFIDAHEKTDALSTLYRLQTLWKNIAKL
ncbi:DUF4363 family protein [Microaerobacter geothermalis]|uniref:DUF4363 family protein n=1 Tax=Microaerobacter geothermalis TaxID=674972 RepID=UPI001F2F4225|nr:DUF4363 family protein [Microaerobacter geothermalis]MCF6094956.1 DUF4363 family protein [Microaerobacter geothermalis]